MLGVSGGVSFWSLFGADSCETIIFAHCCAEGAAQSSSLEIDGILETECRKYVSVKNSSDISSSWM